MTYRIEQHTGTGHERFAECQTLDDARDLSAQWIGRTLTPEMKGACPDEDDGGLIGVECWMPYLDDNHIPDGTVFVYRAA